MRRVLHLSRSAVFLLRQGQFGELGEKLVHRVVDDTSLVGLRLDLEQFTVRIPEGNAVRVRPADRSDLVDLLSLIEPGLDRRERHERTQRLRMMEADVERCYVAEKGGGSPCFVQWLIPASQTERLQEVYGGWYPPLHDGQALLEFAYTAPSHRGQGVMTAATSQVLEIGRLQGVKTVLTFIPTENRRSLSIHLRMGFVPYCLHRERRRLWRLRREFLPVNSLREVTTMVPGFNADQFEAVSKKPNQ